MKLDFKSLAFGYSLADGTSTPAWETALGQGTGYKLRDVKTISELAKGMIYKAVSPSTIAFKKGKGGNVVKGDDESAAMVIAAVFDKVYINDALIQDGKFVLLIVKDETEHHKGRFKLKYGLDNMYTDNEGVAVKNRDFQKLATQQMGLAEDACWFVYDISVKNQDSLYLRAIIVDKDGSKSYDSASALHSAWNPLIEADMKESGIEENLTIEQLADILKEMYDNPGVAGKAMAPLIFGFKYADVIETNKYSTTKIKEKSSLPKAYDTEISKGINMYKALQNGELGINDFLQDKSEREDIFGGFDAWLISYDNPDYTGTQKYAGYPKALSKLIKFMFDKNLIEDEDLNDKNIEKYNSWIEIYNATEEVKEYDKRKLGNQGGIAALKKYVKYIEFLLFPHAEDFDYLTTKNDSSNKIFFGVPGCGKSYHIEYAILGKEKGIEKYKNYAAVIRTTFYQDYSNTDFVGQILPKIFKDETGKDIVEYIFNPGPFTLALIKAISNPTKKVALVVEEINRGNAPAIFGDIFQLLDRDANSISEYGIINVGISDYLNDYEFIVDGKKAKYYFNEIKIPGNLDIFATMNTSDQNVYTLDTAFTRRWEKERIPNEFNGHAIKDMLVPGMNTCTWGKFVDAINNHIKENLESLQVNEDKQVGAFFIKERDLLAKTETINDEKIKAFAYKVLEYLWDDVSKLDHSIIFNPSFKTFEELVKAFVKNGAAVFNDKIKKELCAEEIQAD